MTEAQWQAQVLWVANFCGWWCWHDNDSRRNRAGFLDLLLIRGGRLIWVELKTNRGRLRSAQRDMIARLREAGQDVRLWRPRDWLEVLDTLDPARMIVRPKE